MSIHKGGLSTKGTLVYAAAVALLETESKNIGQRLSPQASWSLSPKNRLTLFLLGGRSYFRLSRQVWEQCGWPNGWRALGERC